MAPVLLEGPELSTRNQCRRLKVVEVLGSLLNHVSHAQLVGLVLPI